MILDYLKLFISPHNDDAALFGAFTIMTHQPLVLTVFDSYVQPARGFAGCDAATRRAEDVAAMAILGTKVEFMGMRDNAEHPVWRIADRIKENTLCVPDEVWAPMYDTTGNKQHNEVARAASMVFQDTETKLHYYSTYHAAGKSFDGRKMERDGAMALRKLQALACYESQFGVPNCVDHFLRSQEEYIIEAAS